MAEKGDEMATMQALPETKKATEIKRLNLNLSQHAYDEVQKLAEETHQSITQLVRLGLGVLRIAVEEARQGNKIQITSPDGRPIREIVIPH